MERPDYNPKIPKGTKPTRLAEFNEFMKNPKPSPPGYEEASEKFMEHVERARDVLGRFMPTDDERKRAERMLRGDGEN